MVPTPSVSPRCFLDQRERRSLAYERRTHFEYLHEDAAVAAPTHAAVVAADEGWTVGRVTGREAALVYVDLGDDDFLGPGNGGEVEDEHASVVDDRWR